MRREFSRPNRIRVAHMAESVEPNVPPSGRVADMLGGTFLVVFGLLSATRIGRLALPGLPLETAPFLVVPFGCLAFGAVVQARSLRDRSVTRAGAWVLACGFLVTFGNVVIINSFLFGVPVRNGFIWGFAAGCVLVTLGSVAMGSAMLSADAPRTRTGLLLVGWPPLAVLTIVAFVLFGVGSVVAAVTIPLGVTWVVLAGPRLQLQ